MTMSTNSIEFLAQEICKTDFVTDNQHFQGVTVAADWIRDLESSDSRLHKESVIEKALTAARLGSANAQCFLFNCYLAYNPFFVYHVRQVPESTGVTGRANPWPRFWALCESLRTRSVTGGRAHAAIAEVMSEFDSTEWNGMCRRVLIKDLRCGISEKTLNKVLARSEYRIPVFTCQLAQDSSDRADKMQGPRRLEVKLDGVRVLAVISGDGVTLYSRNGKVFDNFSDVEYDIEQILPQLRNQLDFAPGVSFVLDGEIVGESFQKLMRQAHRKYDADATGMVYHVFDVVPLKDFESGVYRYPQRQRQEQLERCRDLLRGTNTVRVMPGETRDLSTPEGQQYLVEFFDAAIAQGYEGIMIKDPDAAYECKRTSSWLKWKPTITVDLNIVGFEEGTGRNAGRLGAIICEGVDDGRDIRVNVGSGFGDSDRDEYWTHRDQLLGRIVEVQADTVSQNQDGSYSLRFPRFVRFRGFEAGEKL
jgi:DNA ligase-1